MLLTLSASEPVQFTDGISACGERFIAAMTHVLVIGTRPVWVSVLLLRTSPKRTTLSLITHLEVERRMLISGWPWHPTCGQAVGCADVASTCLVIQLNCSNCRTEVYMVKHTMAVVWYIYLLQVGAHPVAMVCVNLNKYSKETAVYRRGDNTQKIQKHSLHKMENKHTKQHKSNIKTISWIIRK